ncbi:hypothetical protein CCP3SC1AL1_2280002 [Gammaproteobacteria bacterium]
MSKPETIAKWKETAGTRRGDHRHYVLQCQVVCIGYAIDNDEVCTMVSVDEHRLMEEFIKKLSRKYCKELIRCVGLPIMDLPLITLLCGTDYVNMGLMTLCTDGSQNQLVDTMKLADIQTINPCYHSKNLPNFMA